jgi:hypothetical protein
VFLADDGQRPHCLTSRAVDNYHILGYLSKRLSPRYSVISEP